MKRTYMMFETLSIHSFTQYHARWALTDVSFQCGCSVGVAKKRNERNHIVACHVHQGWIVFPRKRQLWRTNMQKLNAIADKINQLV